MNEELVTLLELNHERWEREKTPGLADRLLKQMCTMSAQAVGKRQRDQQHRFRGKPHGWSHKQLILYAQLAAMVEMRRRLFGLAGRTAWRKQHVRGGIVGLTQHWRDLIRKYPETALDPNTRVGIGPWELERMEIKDLTRTLLDDQIKQIDNQLHYARRAKVRADINEAIREREAKFHANKIRPVLNSVLQKSRMQFTYRTVTKENGEVETDPVEIQRELTESFRKWHEKRPLIDLAEYLVNTPEIWTDFERQAEIPSIHTDTSIPPEIVELFTKALLHGTDNDELMEEMRDVLARKITLEDFKKALSVRSNNKAGGITGCTINMIKQWEPNIQEFAYELMNTMWENRHIPKWWKDKWVVLIPKEDMPDIPVSKLRPICLLETTRKVWTAIIMARVMGVLHRRGTLQSMQAGFTPGTSTDQCLLQIINAIEQAEQQKSTLYYTSYDISKAFDRPPKGIIKMCWMRVGVPEDIAEWLIQLDIGGRAYIKSPWAQRQIGKGKIISDTDCPFFEAETGVPQGSSEGACTWLILFDVLLTMLKLDEASDLYIADHLGALHRQWPTAFADDLMTYAATAEMNQRQADIIGIYCMMIGLEIAPNKMIARVIHPETTDEIEIIKLWTMAAQNVDIQISKSISQTELMRYLGIHLDSAGTWEGQLNKIKAKIAEAVRVLTHSRASQGVKWYAVSTSSYSAIQYPEKYAPWTLEEYDAILRPINRILRDLTYA